MQIFKDFGINPILLSAQIVNFLIILFVLKRFAYKPVLDVLKKRQKELEQGLLDSEKAKTTLLEAEEKEKQILQKAQLRADKIITDTKSRSAELRNSAEDSTKKEIERMLEQSRAQINEETRMAEEKLTKNIGQIAVGLLEKSLKGIFGQKEQQTIMRRADEVLRKSKNL